MLYTMGNTTEKIRLHDLRRVSDHIQKDLDKAYRQTLDESCYLRGSSVTRFEEKWAEYTGAEDCCALTSGTDALHTAAMITGVGPGDEVIMPAHGFIATIEPFLHTGATIRYVDSKISDYCVDEDKIEQQITDKTKVIVWADINGQTPDIDKIMAVAKKHNLITVEDAAPSAGASYKGRKVGTLADITCFSFGPVKPLGAIGGAGGITGSREVCDQAREIRNHGRGKGTGRDGFVSLGWNRNIHTMQAAFLMAKLPYLDELNDMKRQHALRYNEKLKGLVDHVPSENQGRYHPFHLYSVLVKQRNTLKDRLGEQGIETLIHWQVGLHEYPFTTDATIPLPNTEKISKSTLSLPCSPFLTLSEQDRVIEQIANFYERS